MPTPKDKADIWTVVESQTTVPKPEKNPYKKPLYLGKKATTYNASKTYAVSPWRLDVNLDLSMQCADFYLLMRLELEGVDKGLFDEKVRYLENQFSLYTDMVVGGELRHIVRSFLAKSKDFVAKPLADALRSGPLKKYTSRHDAWLGWYFLRERYGKVAISWAMGAFYTPKAWGSSYGGPAWGNIAKTLHRYETNVYTPVSFIDTCFGLQHNGGIYFNKVWSIHGLKPLLDAKKHDLYEVLSLAASTKVRALWKESGIE